MDQNLYANATSHLKIHPGQIEQPKRKKYPKKKLDNKSSKQAQDLIYAPLPGIQIYFMLTLILRLNK